MLKKLEKDFWGQKLTFETGRLALNADSAVLVSLGQTTVLVTVVSNQTDEISDFFPLKVEYEERFYAGGLISGSRFSRREGRPTDDAVVEARLIDHAIRPLFEKDFMNDTQITITALSSDGVNSAGLLGFLGVSAALGISGYPFHGPIIPLRIQKHKESSELLFNLNIEDHKADLDMVVSYLDDGEKVHAIEACAHIVSEQDVVAAIKQGAEKSKELFAFVNEFINLCGAKEQKYTRSWLNKDTIKKVSYDILPVLEDLRAKDATFESEEWNNAVSAIVIDLVKKYEGEFDEEKIKILISEVNKLFVRDLVLKKGERLDSRKFDEIRPLSAEVTVLPRVHGSGLFSRGLTQALSVVTLASNSYNLLIQGMHGDKEKKYIHHYNFPPFSTGEIGRPGNVSRRSIGHGMLAEKALLAVLPDEEKFPYVIRIVSEILSSNGSTSMAATCGSSLALMDAGVPIKEHVAGIGVGLFVDTQKDNPDLSDYKLLVDIIGHEDYAGYMDFKMTGTSDGVTAIQMELKLRGLPIELLDSLFEISKSSRMKVLDLMNSIISESRSSLNEYAPKLEMLKVDKTVIGTIIGSGGVMIKQISKQFGCEVDIEEKEDFGYVSIVSKSIENIKQAKEYILSIITPIQVGDVFEGVVTRIEDYGAFVELAPKQTGLLHVSEFSHEYTDNIRDHMTLGDKVKVKVISMENGKASVSKKALDESVPYVERPQREEHPRNDRFDRGRPRQGGGRGRY